MSQADMQDPLNLMPKLDEMWNDRSFVEAMDELFETSLNRHVYKDERIIGEPIYKLSQKNSEQSNADGEQPQSATASKFFSSNQKSVTPLSLTYSYPINCPICGYSDERYQELVSLDDEHWDANVAKLGEGMSNDVPDEMLWYVKWLEANPDNGRSMPVEVDDES